MVAGARGRAFQRGPAVPQRPGVDPTRLCCQAGAGPCTLCGKGPQGGEGAVKTQEPPREGVWLAALPRGCLAAHTLLAPPGPAAPPAAPWAEPLFLNTTCQTGLAWVGGPGSHTLAAPQPAGSHWGSGAWGPRVSLPSDQPQPVARQAAGPGRAHPCAGGLPGLGETQPEALRPSELLRTSPRQRAQRLHSGATDKV